MNIVAELSNYLDGVFHDRGTICENDQLDSHLAISHKQGVRRRVEQFRRQLKILNRFEEAIAQHGTSSSRQLGSNERQMVRRNLRHAY